ncbi:hypothetical protein BVX99_03390 [bacterium F16]|nr:hypothetical protein BVX99_03390 [bacterium F16]
MRLITLMAVAIISGTIIGADAQTTTESAKTTEAATAGETTEVTVDGKTMPVNMFLAYLRYPRVQSSWMTMKGKLINKSKDGIFKVPIEVRGRFQEDSWRMQLIISNWERWYVRQNFNDGEFGTSKIQEKKPVTGERSLADYNIRPDDITLSFLYWDFVKEESPEKVSGQHCRVLRLRNRTTSEEALVWVSSKYIFTMKVQWFKKGQTTFHRELLFKDFNIYKPKSNSDIKIAMIEEVRIQGNGWKTMITFEKPEGDIVNDEHLAPVDLFLKEPKTDEN